MKMKDLTRKLNTKFRSPEEPELEWYIEDNRDELHLVNLGLGRIHLDHDLLIDETGKLVLRFEFTWAEEEHGLSIKVSKAFRAAADYIEDLGEIIVPVE